MTKHPEDYEIIQEKREARKQRPGELTSAGLASKNRAGGRGIPQTARPGATLRFHFRGAEDRLSAPPLSTAIGFQPLTEHIQGCQFRESKVLKTQFPWGGEGQRRES